MARKERVRCANAGRVSFLDCPCSRPGPRLFTKRKPANCRFMACLSGSPATGSNSSDQFNARPRPLGSSLREPLDRPPQRRRLSNYRDPLPRRPCPPDPGPERRVPTNLADRRQCSAHRVPAHPARSANVPTTQLSRRLRASRSANRRACPGAGRASFRRRPNDRTPPTIPDDDSQIPPRSHLPTARSSFPTHSLAEPRGEHYEHAPSGLFHLQDSSAQGCLVTPGRKAGNGRFEFRRIAPAQPIAAITVGEVFITAGL